jgi:hypothetical protein
MSIVMSEDAMKNFPPIPEGHKIVPQPNWIRPASDGSNIWHGYCGSGPEDGVVCPFGAEWEPEQIDGVWYWVKSL